MSYADHVEASAYAAKTQPKIAHTAKVLSATIKSPASASSVGEYIFPRQGTAKDRQLKKRSRNRFHDFMEACDPSSLPPDLGWLRKETETVIQIV
ncbi:hypothetical protein FGG78_44635, partial [Thioclava sp. BHET1]